MYIYCIKIMIDPYDGQISDVKGHEHCIICASSVTIWEYLLVTALARSFLEPGGSCTKSTEISESCSERVKKVF